ncbi:hypothetical protein ACFP81_07775 [Deinococcus lacus]|uniref:Uncharacterized protein n=1 Tax=Deinococcus lacus TaxID=392561 RepID=A0ABW1YCH8_9DEIO
MKKTTIAVSLVAALLLNTAQAITLPETDCAKSGGDARCKVSGSDSIGQGLPFNLGGFVSFGSGFVDVAENAVYVPVEFGGQQDNRGVIFKVDLKTGNRSVVSGYDGEEWHGKAPQYVSGRGEKFSPYDLGRVEVVRPGPGGSLLALVDKGLQERTEIIRIDRKSGDRSVVWASRVYADSANEGPSSVRTNEAKLGINGTSDGLCRASDDRIGLKPSEVLETDGKYIYLFMQGAPSGTGTGLVRVPVTGGKCEWVSRYYQDGTSDIGSGATVNTLSPAVFDSAFANGKFYGVTGPVPSGNVLFSIDTRTGERQTISIRNEVTPARSKGTGDVAVGRTGRMALTGDSKQAVTLFPTLNDTYFEPVVVDIQSGERFVSEASAGSLSSGRDSNGRIVAGLPGTDQFVVAFNGALHIWDGATGNSYVLSR